MVGKIRKAEGGRVQEGGSSVHGEGREMGPWAMELTWGRQISITCSFKNQWWYLEPGAFKRLLHQHLGSGESER